MSKIKKLLIFIFIIVIFIISLIILLNYFDYIDKSKNRKKADEYTAGGGGFSSCGGGGAPCNDPSLPSQLYKYDIEKLDYSKYENMYEIHYTGTMNGAPVKGESSITLNKDGSCSYTHSLSTNVKTTDVVQGSHSSTVVNSEVCNFELKGNELIITAKVKNIYQDNYYSDSTDEDLNITGVFDDNYKYLQIDKLKYSSMNYNRYLEMNMTKVLIDPITKSSYTMSGVNVWNDYDIIDLSKYNIVDKNNSEKGD